MIHKFSVVAAPEQDPSLPDTRAALGLSDLRIWRDYYIEFDPAPPVSGLTALARALGDGDIGVRVLVDVPLPAGAVQVAYRTGVVDNESDSIVVVCSLLGLVARAGKVAVTYRSDSPRLREVIAATRYNENIEELRDTEPAYRSLVPAGVYEPAARVDLLALSDEELAGLGRANGRNLSPDKMRQLRRIQEKTGAPWVCDVLLEAMDARWSDHCAHTTWTSLGGLLGRLVRASRDTGNPNVVSMFDDNAGVWDLDGTWAVAIKAETHNGPSAVSAYFGQLTKLGGVLRDILGTGLGADPIGCFEYTATGLPEAPAPVPGRPSPRRIAGETIRAIKEYGNTFGVPMMYSRMAFHPSYRAKPFALGGCVGLIPRDRAQRGRPRAGDLVVLIGGLTGNEGIHGASASSAGATIDGAAVQIGAPLEQVTFRKAIIELRDAGCLRAITDVGGAGLNSAVGEIGERCGVWINTALVPLKTSALPMWRILLSESQERMILAVAPECVERATGILRRHRVRATVIGRFTGTGRYCVFHAPKLSEADVLALGPGEQPADLGEVGFDVPYDLLRYEPEPLAVGAVPEPVATPVRWPQLDGRRLEWLLSRVLADPEVASQRYADAQYDTTVQGNTYYGPNYGTVCTVPSSYWAATPVDGSPVAVVFAAAFAPWLYPLHPVRALRQMFAAALVRQVLAGVALGDVCLCDNFYTPHLCPGGHEWLVAMVDELAGLVRRFGVPVISGKDSSAGSTHTPEGLVHVPPAVFLSSLGKVPDAAVLLPEQWSRAGNVLVRIGVSTPSPAATAAARVLDLPADLVDEVDLDELHAYLSALPAARGYLRSGTPVGAGGVAARAVVGALASGLGVDLDADPADAAGLFAEHRCGALVEVAESDVSRLPGALRPVVVGRLSAEPGVRVAGRELLTRRARECWTGSFAARIA